MSLLLTTRSDRKAIIEREAALFPGLAEKSANTRVRGTFAPPEPPSFTAVGQGYAIIARYDLR